MSKLPEYLIISFQRYNSRTRTKNSCGIKCSETLDISNFVDRDILKSLPQYNLIGISNHSGSMSFGHYFAYCNSGGVWFECNDSLVTKTDTVVNRTSSSACVFIYEKNV